MAATINRNSLFQQLLGQKSFKMLFKAFRAWSKKQRQRDAMMMVWRWIARLQSVSNASGNLLEHTIHAASDAVSVGLEEKKTDFDIPDAARQTIASHPSSSLDSSDSYKLWWITICVGSSVSSIHWVANCILWNWHGEDSKQRVCLEKVKNSVQVLKEFPAELQLRKCLHTKTAFYVQFRSKNDLIYQAFVEEHLRHCPVDKLTKLSDGVSHLNSASLEFLVYRHSGSGETNLIKSFRSNLKKLSCNSMYQTASSANRRDRRKSIRSLIAHSFRKTRFYYFSSRCTNYSLDFYSSIGILSFKKIFRCFHFSPVWRKNVKIVFLLFCPLV